MTISHTGSPSGYQANVPIAVNTISADRDPIVDLYSLKLPSGSMWLNRGTQSWFIWTNKFWQQFTSGGSPSAPFRYYTVSASQAMSSNSGYLVPPSSTPIFLDLPSSSSVGDTLIVTADVYALGPDPLYPGFTISQNAFQQILYGNTSGTTFGATGSLKAVAQGQTVVMVCVTANTIWNVQVVSFGSLIFN